MAAAGVVLFPLAADAAADGLFVAYRLHNGGYLANVDVQAVQVIAAALFVAGQHALVRVRLKFLTAQPQPFATFQDDFHNVPLFHVCALAFCHSWRFSWFVSVFAHLVLSCIILHNCLEL